MEFDIKSIFGSDLIFYNQIINQYYDNLNSIITYNNINCYIEFNNIITNNNYNCIINLKNQCVSNEKLAFSILFNTISSHINLISDDLKNRLETNMGVDFNKSFENNLNSGYIGRCNAMASTTSNINIGVLKITNCYSDIPLVFNFLNNGSVLSNCGIYEFTNAISDTANYNNNTTDDTEKKILYSVLGLDIYNLIIIIICSFIIILILFFFNIKNLKHKLITTFKINKKLL